MPNGELPVSLEIVNQDSDMITGDTIQNRIHDFTNESFWSLKEKTLITILSEECGFGLFFGHLLQ